MLRSIRHALVTVALVPMAAFAQAPTQPRVETAVFAGGCFWGVEAVFEHVRGVIDVKSGYAGGDRRSANYDLVGTGRTQHAESVEITFDPTKVTYGELLRVFFSVAHDATQKDRQGPDVGPQYRSAIFYTSAAQAQQARAYVAQLTEAKFYRAPIVTEIAPLVGFYDAEAYHQDFATLHPTHPYIVYHDLPKIERLRAGLPELYRERGQTLAER